MLARDSAPLVGIALDETAMNRQVVPLHQYEFKTASHAVLKQLLEQLRLLETPVPILRKRGVMRDLLIEAQAGKPTPGQMHAQFLDHLARTGNAIQVADQEEAQQKLGINRWTARLAIAVLQLFAHKGKANVLFDEPQPMILRHLIFQAEIVEQRFRTRMSPHHD